MTTSSARDASGASRERPFLYSVDKFIIQYNGHISQQNKEKKGQSMSWLGWVVIGIFGFNAVLMLLMGLWLYRERRRGRK